MPSRRFVLTGGLGRRPRSAAERPEQREAAVDGAQREGQLALANSVSLAGFPRFMQAFEAKYPFISTSAGLYGAPTGRGAGPGGRGEMKAGALTFDALHVASLAPVLGPVPPGKAGRLRFPRAPRLSARGARPRPVGDGAHRRRDHGLQPQHAAGRDKAPKAWIDLLSPSSRAASWSSRTLPPGLRSTRCTCWRSCSARLHAADGRRSSRSSSPRRRN